MHVGRPVCLDGDSGTGKSRLLRGFGTAAAEAGFRICYVTAAALVNELVEAANDSTCPEPSPATDAPVSLP
ncbi:ATP-binding protein [Amycolatopsis australiensis]|uniref:ATP-binding protein n=1 Tax=Amycolatopsis australiensis TaxID=546364 RepID=UPI0009305CD6|nr:ATP-binding protein [Amycolatopsis australiensis]